MTLQDVAAAILLRQKQFQTLTQAKDEILIGFRKEFPYWHFIDWNINVSRPIALILLKMYEDESVTIKQLILDLPSIVQVLKEHETPKPINKK